MTLIHQTSYPVTPTSFAASVPSNVQNAYHQGRIPPNVSINFLMASKDAPCRNFIIFMICFTTLFVGLRIFSRAVLARSFGYDDALAMVSTFMFIAMAILDIILINIGSGRHIEYVQYVMSDATMFLSERLDFYAHILYTIGLFLCRLSGIAFYLRLSKNLRKLQIIVYSATAWITSAFLVQLFLLIFHCFPVTDTWPYVWQLEIQNFRCLTWGVVYVSNSAISLASDFLIFTIPVIIIVTLQGQPSAKAKLTAILCPGVLVVAVSATRLYYVIQGGFQYDAAWFYSPTVTIEVTEVGLTLIALSAPGINVFFHRLVTKEIAAARSNGSGSGGGGGIIASPKTNDKRWSLRTTELVSKNQNQHHLLGHEHSTDQDIEAGEYIHLKYGSSQDPQSPSSFTTYHPSPVLGHFKYPADDDESFGSPYSPKTFDEKQSFR